ncbi:Sodium- and chloride-dependent GABA transporter 2 [Nymphon striatum]|nr:Sodium- and chloride-dependent GABA transporter 2 [Nymphon striatum]
MEKVNEIKTKIKESSLRNRDKIKMVKSGDPAKLNAKKVVEMETGIIHVPAKHPESADSSKDMPERGKWNNKLDFFMSSLSYAIGLGNVWRFPYLCYQYGGGAFLLPYLICLVTCGIPIFYMEVALGQAMSAGSISIWKISPIMKGIGYATMSIVAFSNIYYVIIIAWTLFYLISSFNTVLPWADCSHSWNTDNCTNRNDLNFTNSTIGETETSVEQFWNDRVLQITKGIDDLGGIQWELFGCLILAWIIVYLVIWKGIHSSGKIIWFTALFPYTILFTLLIRGAMLEGAANGLYYFIYPQFEELLDPQVWVVAGSQIFYTFGIGMGSLIALGSYNDYHHNSLRDSLVVCAVGVATSLLAGTVIFCVLGHMAFVQHKEVKEVVSSGPGLAFLSYPDVITELPISPLWAVLFFFMLTLLGIDTEFCCVEALITGLVDEFPQYLRPRRKLFTALVCIFMFILGIPMVSQGGMYLFQLLDNYAVSGITLLFIVFWQTFAVSWIYGANKLVDTIKDMTGIKPPIYFVICWKFISLFIILAIFIFSFVKYTPLVYAKVYTYPDWGYVIGWMTGVSSMLWIPGYFIYYLIFVGKGQFTEKIRDGLWPPTEKSAVGFKTGNQEVELISVYMKDASSLPEKNCT